MGGLLDTSVVVRYLTGEPAAMAEAAAEIIDGNEVLVVTDVVLLETAYVLGSVYGIDRPVIVDHLMDLLTKENIGTFCLDKGQVLQALLLCRPSGRVSFADALLWAAGQSTDNKLIYSFDRRFPTDGIEVRARLP